MVVASEPEDLSIWIWIRLQQTVDIMLTNDFVSRLQAALGTEGTVEVRFNDMKPVATSNQTPNPRRSLIMHVSTERIMGGRHDIGHDESVFRESASGMLVRVPRFFGFVCMCMFVSVYIRSSMAVT